MQASKATQSRWGTGLCENARAWERLTGRVADLRDNAVERGEVRQAEIKAKKDPTNAGSGDGRSSHRREGLGTARAGQGVGTH